jgi:hypothetical protein
VMAGTNATLMITNVQAARCGSYQVWVANTIGSIYSQPAILSVVASPVITVNPQSMCVPLGSNATLQVTAAGTGPFVYQWYFNTSPLPGANAAFLTLTNVDPSASGTYQVMVNNSVGQATSQPAFVTIAGYDSDGDGIPDSWMMANFGHPTGMAGDLSRAQDDADGDGMSNLQEYLAGTNPLDSESSLQLQLSAGVIGNGHQLQFTAVAGISYTMQYSTNLVGGTWLKLMDVPADPTTRQLILTDSGSTSAPCRFYRLVTPLQP